MTASTPHVRLRRYAAGFEQPAHEHAQPHLSLLMAGTFEELIGGRSATPCSGRVGLRPEGLSHAVAFGPAGAIVLTCPAPTRPDGSQTVTEPAWSGPLPSSHLRRLTPLLLECGDEALEAGWDLLALAAAQGSPLRADPWLETVREALREAPAQTRLSDLAAAAGRHRVHVGRAFMAAYGEAPSVFRRRVMLDRALGLIAGGVSQADAAADAGFSDQSHFSRACRDAWGVAPGRLLRQAT